MNLTELEKEHDKRLSDFVFQLELGRDLTTREVASLFIEYGDVTVVKVTKLVYWVDFESFDSDEVATSVQGTLGRVIQHVKAKHQGLITSIKEYREATRFPTYLPKVENHHKASNHSTKKTPTKFAQTTF